MAQSATPEDAFRALLSEGSYSNADFYIKNKLIDAADLDTGQIFFDVLMGQYSKDLSGNAKKIDKLYVYLNGLKPVEMNRPVNCKDIYGADQGLCYIGINALTGAPLSFIRYLVERGLNLNYQPEGLVPTTVPLLLRLGSIYSVSDLNALNSMGLVLGDETYPVLVLSQYQDGYLNSGRLQIPANYSNLGDLNLLDFAVIALGTKTNSYDVAGSSRDESLCRFISYAAASFQPSFDYLQYLMETKENFRGGKIGRTERGYQSVVYRPFPSSCVSLIQSMAGAHEHLEEVISRFAVEKDVATARWLMSLKPQGAAAETTQQ